MASYTVISANFVPFAEGTTVTGEQLEGCNVDALIEAGHLQPAGEVEPPTQSAPAVLPPPPVPPTIPAPPADPTSKE